MSNNKKDISATRKLFEWNIIILLFIVFIGILASIRFNGNKVEFDLLTLQITSILCGLFEFMMLIRVYPIIRDITKEEEKREKRK